MLKRRSRKSRKRCGRTALVHVSATLLSSYLYILYRSSLLILSMNVLVALNLGIPFRVAITVLSSLPLLSESANERRYTSPLLRPTPC